MAITVLGIDLAKSVFQLHGVDHHGKPVYRKKVSRARLRETVHQLPPCLIGMEACASSSYWAREFEKMGHTVKLMSPQFVKPYVKSNKNDRNDAEAICEAVSRPSMRFVPIKSVEQQDVQAMHRVRSQLIKQRTALINQIRGLLGEYGISLAQRPSAVKAALPGLLEDAENALTPLVRELFAELYDQLQALETRIERCDGWIERVFQDSAGAQRLARIEGIGRLTATALVAAVGDAHAFKNGRQLAAWLGLVPKQHSSGGKERLLSITKRGDPYLRMLLIHGARTVLHHAMNKHDARSRWLQGVMQRGGPNKAAVALANKNARVVHALLVSEQDYRLAA